MKYVLFLVIGLVIGAGVMMYVVNQQQSKIYKSTNKQIDKKIISESYPPFSVEEAPKNSLQGTVSDTAGTFLYEPRGATEPAELSEITTIQQGERLITKEKGAATITYPTVGTVQMGENTDLSFIQTLPVNLALWHNNGTATYTVNGETPFSVRIRSALLTKKDGEMTVEMEDGDSIVVIKTTKGTATIGYNDPDNVTQVFELREGQTYKYNSDERTTINAARE